MTDKDAETAALKAEVARLEAIADDLAERLGQERAVSDELAGEITRLSVRSSRAHALLFEGIGEANDG